MQLYKICDMLFSFLNRIAIFRFLSFNLCWHPPVINTTYTADQERYYKEFFIVLKKAISEFSCARNLSYENEFCMPFHFHANQSHFHKNGFALRLSLKQRHKRTQKWPISHGMRRVCTGFQFSSLDLKKLKLQIQ